MTPTKTAGRGGTSGLQALQTRYGAELVLHLVAREFRLRYQRSALGLAWSVGQPLARLLVLAFVFTKILPLDVPDYPLFLFVGLIGWGWFSSGVSSATTSALARRELLFRPGVPRSAVPLVSVLTDGLDYLTALPVLAVFLVVADEVHLTALALPFVLAPMVAMTLGIGMVLCACNVYARDVHLIVELVVLLGFYITPVFYAESTIPPEYRWFLDINPMAWALDSQRAVLIEGRLPDPTTFLSLVVVSSTLLALGLAVYRRASRTFTDEI